ncbi:MAG: DsbE family thiol:disulfide interchange protein [Maritimibacter sp.]
MKLLHVLPLVVVLLLGIGAFFGLKNKNDIMPSTREGGPVPALTLTELNGEAPFTDADLASGGVVLVNFWASWCAPCRAEAPTLDMMSDEGIAIYGINYKDQPAKAQRFLDEYGNPYSRNAADANGRTGIDWGVTGVPETFVIDGNGIVVKRFAGPITPTILENIIRPAMEEAAGHAAAGSE